MIYTQADIEAHLSPKRFSTGWKLFSEGRVTSPNVQRGGELITAIIPRAGGRPFRVSVRTSHDQDSTTINGECSCGKKTNCEHVAAVMLQALKDQQSLPGATPIARNGAADKSSATSKPAQSQSQQALLYFLHIDEEEGLLVETSVARRMPQGAYSILRHFQPGRAAGCTPPRFLESADLALLGELDQLQHAPVTHLPILDGPRSAQILEGLLATGRCYLDDTATAPLTRGQPRSITFEWTVDEHGYQHPAARTTPQANTLLPLSSCWYLDHEQGECGPVDTDRPVTLVSELLLFPPVAPDRVQQACEALFNTWPDAPVPPPQQLEMETAPRVEPVPQLRLTTVTEELFDSWSGHHDMACLSFDYDGIRINRHTPATRLVDGRLIRVQRDKKSEQAAIRQLRKLGFEEDEDWSEQSGEDCFFLEPELMDNEAEPWFDFQVNDAPALRARGWRIRYDGFRYRLSEASNWVCDIEKLEQQDWFDIGLGVEVDGQRIDLLPILLDFLGHFTH